MKQTFLLERDDYHQSYLPQRDGWGVKVKQRGGIVEIRDFYRGNFLQRGPGYRAGLRDGDVVLSFGERKDVPAVSADQVRTYLSSTHQRGLKTIWLNFEVSVSFAKTFFFSLFIQDHGGAKRRSECDA